MNATYKALLCFLRRKIKNDKFNASVASVISGLWIYMEPKKRRLFVTVLLLSRSVDTTTRLVLNNGVVNAIPHFNVFIWMLCAGLQQYVCSYEQDCLNPGVFKFLRKWAIFMETDVQM
jgi:hypothetical protein